MDSDADIVEIIIKLCQAEGLDPDVARQIEQRIRNEYGGSRVRIPKRRKHPSEEMREKVYNDGVSSMETKEIIDKHGVSRATLYRYLKRGK